MKNGEFRALRSATRGLSALWTPDQRDTVPLESRFGFYDSLRPDTFAVSGLSLSGNLLKIIIKVLVKLFQKLAESRGSASGRAPQSAKNSYAFKSEEKGGLGEETPKGVASPIHQSFVPLFDKKQNTNKLIICRLKSSALFQIAATEE